MNYFDTKKKALIALSGLFLAFQATSVFSQDVPQDSIILPDDKNLQIIVDNSDASFSTFADWKSSTYWPGYIGDDYLHDGSADPDEENWAMWSPEIPSEGYYNIYMSWNSDWNRPNQAPLEIQGKELVLDTVNQQKDDTLWNFVGKFYLVKGSSNYVKIFSVDTGYTIADAVLFEKLSAVTSINSSAQNNFDLQIVSEKERLFALVNLEKQSSVTFKVYNISGILIQTITNKQIVKPGNHQYELDDKNLKNGLYLTVLQVDNETLCSKFIVK